MQVDLKALPVWFLVCLVAFFGTYFLVTIQAFVKKLDSMLEKLFNRTDDLDHRLSNLEGEHKGMKVLHERRTVERK